MSASIARRHAQPLYGRVRAAIYRGDRLPPDLYGNAFVAEPAANFVSRIVLSDEARRSGRARRMRKRSFWRRPTSASVRLLTNAPDGALYVVDMLRGVIQDRMSDDHLLRDHILSRSWMHRWGGTDLSRHARDDEARHHESVCDRNAGEARSKPCRPEWLGGHGAGLLVERMRSPSCRRS